MVIVSQATNANSNLGYGVQRPNLLADPNAPAARSVAQWFNTAAFVTAPQFTLGNASRNPVRGPGLQDADLMIGKTFRVTESVNAEFRAEVFNVSNTTPLNDPNGTCCCQRWRSDRSPAPATPATSSLPSRSTSNRLEPVKVRVSHACPSAIFSLGAFHGPGIWARRAANDPSDGCSRADAETFRCRPRENAPPRFEPRTTEWRRFTRAFGLMRY